MTMVRGLVRPGVGDGQKWEKELMAVIRERTGLTFLRRGTLNIEVADARHAIRRDHEINREENVPSRPEGVTFERCRIWRNCVGLRALFIRTTTDFRKDHKVLELMAEYRLRNLLSLIDGDEVHIEFFNTRAEALNETNGAGLVFANDGRQSSATRPSLSLLRRLATSIPRVLCGRE
jgi:CTP-dependent riboflavin kinase